MNYVYSTMASGVNYTAYRKGGGDLKIKDRHVAIAGGANVANKFLETPKGIATPVTDEELEFLLNHPTFKFHLDNGYVSYEKKKVDIEKAVKNLQEKDKSAPKVAADFERGSTKPDK